MQKSFVQQFQFLIILKADNKFSLSRFSHLKHSVQSLITDLLSTFELFSHTSFNAIDQTINDHINFNAVESKQSKNIYAEIILNALNKRKQIYAAKKISFNTIIFFQVNTYKK